MTTKKEFLAQIRKATKLAIKHGEESDKAKEMLIEFVGEEKADDIMTGDQCGFIDAVDYGLISYTTKDLEKLLKGERW